MNYIYALLGLLIGGITACGGVDSRIEVINQGSRTAGFKIGKDYYELPAGESRSFLNGGAFEWVPWGAASVDHNRILLTRRDRRDFTDFYVFEDNPGIPVRIINAAGAAITLTSIGVFNQTDSAPEEFKTSSEEPLYGHITLANSGTDPFVMESDASQEGTIFTEGPDFLALDENGLKRIVEYTLTSTETGKNMLVTIR
jgi:hypothetical protein